MAEDDSDVWMQGGLIMTIIEISDERSRALLKNREGTNDQRKAVELDEVLLGILHRLDDGTSERKAAYDHLLAIENEMKRRGSRAIWSRFVSVLQPPWLGNLTARYPSK